MFHTFQTGDKVVCSATKREMVVQANPDLSGLPVINFLLSDLESESMEPNVKICCGWIEEDKMNTGWFAQSELRAL